MLTVIIRLLSPVPSSSLVYNVSYQLPYHVTLVTSITSSSYYNCYGKAVRINYKAHTYVGVVSLCYKMRFRGVVELLSV